MTLSSRPNPSSLAYVSNCSANPCEPRSEGVVPQTTSHKLVGPRGFCGPHVPHLWLSSLGAASWFRQPPPPRSCRRVGRPPPPGDGPMEFGGLGGEGRKAPGLPSRQPWRRAQGQLLAHIHQSLADTFGSLIEWNSSMFFLCVDYYFFRNDFVTSSPARQLRVRPFAGSASGRGQRRGPAAQGQRRGPPSHPSPRKSL